MSKFKIGTEVTFIHNNEQIYGFIVDVLGDTVIIEDVDGRHYKQLGKDVAIPVEDSQNYDEPEKEFKVTITREEFRDKTMKAISPEVLDPDNKMSAPMYMITSLSAMLFATHLEKLLFDPVNND